MARDNYNGTEKINKLEKKLSTKDAPAGIDPSVGDIAYYAPWRNVAFFYKDFGYSRGLVKLAGLTQAWMRSIVRERCA